jgi:hypothetical protein
MLLLAHDNRSCRLPPSGNADGFVSESVVDGVVREDVLKARLVIGQFKFDNGTGMSSPPDYSSVGALGMRDVARKRGGCRTDPNG